MISGETDYVVTKDCVVTLNNGHQMMPYVTGMGCANCIDGCILLQLVMKRFGCCGGIRRGW
ncbi:hydroxyethylthiazole kinase [Vibrio chagasii]|nr:hydroxyethylthiazole kinase [Vibrio chagasii]